MTVKERISLRDANTLVAGITVTDPGAFTAPWKVVRTYRRGGPDARIMEYVCEESSRATRGWADYRASKPCMYAATSLNSCALSTCAKEGMSFLPVVAVAITASAVMLSESFAPSE